MATTADIRNGLCIEHNGELWIVVEFQHVKPGKGPAFIRTKLKNAVSGKVLSHTFTSGFKINVQRIENRSYQFLYSEGDVYHFMNNEDFEQTFINETMISAPQLLKEGENVTIGFHAENESAIFCDMPTYVTLEITYTEPGEKGNTATNAFKDATVETGAIVKVPLFINIGDKIKIDTRNGSYSERVKS